VEASSKKEKTFPSADMLTGKTHFYIEIKQIIIDMDKAALVLIILMGVFFAAAIVCIIGGVIGASGITALFQK